MNLVQYGVSTIAGYAFSQDTTAATKEKATEQETVLPESVASLISSISLTSRISLKLWSILLEGALESMKFGSSTTLSLTRQALVHALEAATRYRSVSFIQSADPSHDGLEGYTSLSIYLVHSTFSLLELFTMTGLNLAHSAIQTGYATANESVRLVEGILGNTDSSRALAAIIGLVKKELMSDNESGALSSLAGLTKALTAFACLQIATHHRTNQNQRMTVLFDAVVNAKGETTTVKAAPQNSSEDDEQMSQIVQEQLVELTEDVEDEIGETNSESFLLDSRRPLPRSTGRRILIEETETTERRRTIYIEEDEEEDSSHNHIEDEGWVELGTADKTEEISVAVDKRAEGAQAVAKLGSKPSKEKMRKILRSFGRTFSLRREIITDGGRQVEQQTQSEVTQGCSRDLDENKQVTSKRSHRSSSPLSPILNNVEQDQQVVLKTRESDKGPRKRRKPPAETVHRVKRQTALSSKSFVSQEPGPRNFPCRHLVGNLQRFVKYSSAAYGQTFLRILGINTANFPSTTSAPANHHSFCHHVGISLPDLLLSSYMEPETLDNVRIERTVAYISVDHDAKAVVLTLRGSLGLSDILTDLTAVYEAFELPHAKPEGVHAAHKGILRAAQAIASQRSTVFAVVRKALEELPEYGLVLCGHSLGGGVSALLAALFGQPAISNAEATFVTSDSCGLPAGRPMHAYTYGSPAVATLDVVEYCRGLVTSVVHGNDLVPMLSLGVLRDLKEMAINLNHEPQLAQEIIGRVTGLHQRKALPLVCPPLQQSTSMQQAGADQNLKTLRRLSHSSQMKELGNDEQEQADWLWAIMSTVRASGQHSQKLYPVGRILLIEAQDMFMASTEPDKASFCQAHRIKLREVEDVAARFGEPIFDRRMLFDHSPTAYEHAISTLSRAVFN